MKTLALLLAFMAVVYGKGVSNCSQGMYRPEIDGKCVPCSMCQVNQIVRETCWLNRDTLCGPFTEFDFNKGNTLKLVHDSSTANVDKIVEEAQDDEKGAWHTITMAMIVVLCVTGLLFAVFVSVVCYRCRMQNKDGLIMQIDKDSDFERSDIEERRPVDSTKQSTSQTTATTTTTTTSTTTPASVQSAAATEKNDVMVLTHAHPSRIEQFEIITDNNSSSTT